MSKYTHVSKRNVFTTMDGQEIKFMPFSWDMHLLSEEGLRQEYRESGEIIDCPQYTVKFAGGTQQTFDHDSKSVTQAPKDTPPEDVERVIAEQKELWAKYQDATARYDAQCKADMANLVMIESLAHITLPEDTAWEEQNRKQYPHVKIPTDPELKRQHYINTVLMKYRADQIDFMSTVVAVSMGASREADIDIVKRSFLDSLWGNGAEPVPGRDAAGKVENTQVGQLDGQPPADTDTGEKGMATDQG